MRATVGIFDSGVGGLSVAEALHRLAPALPIHYLADTAFFPYGDRTAEEIRERTVEMVRRLIDEGANVIVIAMTRSPAALQRLRLNAASGAPVRSHSASSRRSLSAKSSQMTP